MSLPIHVRVNGADFKSTVPRGFCFSNATIYWDLLQQKQGIFFYKFHGWGRGGGACPQTNLSCDVLLGTPITLLYHKALNDKKLLNEVSWMKDFLSRFIDFVQFSCTGTKLVPLVLTGKWCLERPPNALRMQENPRAAGAPPRTPLGELAALPQTP